MGIPYSREINAAFEQVTPLVAAGFEVLQTTKNISILLAAIQVLTVILLGFILAALIGVLICIDPDLREEKQALVTPAVNWVASWVMKARGWQILLLGLFSLSTLAAIGVLVFVYVARKTGDEWIEGDEPEEDASPLDGEVEASKSKSKAETDSKSKSQ